MTSSNTDGFLVQRIARPRRKPHLDAGYTVQVTGFNTVIEVTRLRDGVYSAEDSEKAAQIIATCLNRYGARKEASMTNDPHFTVNAVFVPYGYQVDYLMGGKPLASECRDFGDDHEMADLKQSFYEHMQAAVEAFRKGK
jgi:hypothetical protein